MTADQPQKEHAMHEHERALTGGENDRDRGPDDQPAGPTDDLGRVAYEAAWAERLSRRPSDEVIKWEELKEGIRGMWNAAAAVVIDNAPTVSSRADPICTCGAAQGEPHRSPGATTSPVEAAFQAGDQMAAYAPFGQPGTLLEDDEGAPFPEETQQLFREVAQDAYLRGIRDQRDREPVGPYAPTRVGPTLEDLPQSYFESGYRQGWRDRNIDGAPRYPDLTKWDGTYGGRGDHPDTVAELKRIRETEFERGRQQGDADRAQRGLAEFMRGRSVGRSEREAELLDQGWTPPGAIVDLPQVHTLEVTSGPTDYELWRDAVAIAGSQRHRGQLDPGDMHMKAEWFWELLQEVPVQKACTDPDGNQCLPLLPAGNPDSGVTIQSGIGDDGVPYARTVPADKSGYAE